MEEERIGERIYWEEKNYRAQDRIPKLEEVKERGDGEWGARGRKEGGEEDLGGGKRTEGLEGS